ncbi:VWA domain-containing protein [Lishizhenia sp.]|uniref:vWA domain-containing protein n=1 Tax=Lishizhenia sp. TaxID=2497594 RepID=UPI00299E62F1|nr:VWA domain-containing protein [Lishizhenia sp.]MDX1445460.1 VWA domain-containing protein [Lishizhenia sp.]
MFAWIHIDFWNYTFLSPNWLWLLLIVPIYFVWLVVNSKKEKGDFKTSLDIHQIEKLDGFAPQLLHWAVHITFLLGVAAFIIALAQPLGAPKNQEDEFSEGIDIILAMDISGSMMQTDFLPNRLEAAKSVAKDFIDGRKNDRIGLVAYEGEAYTACPATRNHSFLKKCIDKLQSGYLINGTAIGTGLGTAVTRLRSDSLESKVIILLTDGASNRGELSPLEAAELAKQKDITVYTIGVGGDQNIGGFFSSQLFSSDIDEKTLEKIADITGGKYFRAKDKNSLIEIYDKIEKMETRKLIDNYIQQEPPTVPLPFILTGLFLITLAWVVRKFFFEAIG